MSSTNFFSLSMAERLLELVDGTRSFFVRLSDPKVKRIYNDIFGRPLSYKNFVHVTASDSPAPAVLPRLAQWVSQLAAAFPRLAVARLSNSGDFWIFSPETIATKIVHYPPLDNEKPDRTALGISKALIGPLGVAYIDDFVKMAELTKCPYILQLRDALQNARTCIFNPDGLGWILFGNRDDVEHRINKNLCYDIGCLLYDNAFIKLSDIEKWYENVFEERIADWLSLSMPGPGQNTTASIKKILLASKDFLLASPDERNTFVAYRPYFDNWTRNRSIPSDPVLSPLEQQAYAIVLPETVLTPSQLGYLISVAHNAPPAIRPNVTIKDEALVGYNIWSSRLYDSTIFFYAADLDKPHQPTTSLIKYIYEINLNIWHQSPLVSHIPTRAMLPSYDPPHNATSTNRTPIGFQAHSRVREPSAGQEPHSASLRRSNFDLDTRDAATAPNSHSTHTSNKPAPQTREKNNNQETNVASRQSVPQPAKNPPISLPKSADDLPDYEEDEIETRIAILSSRTPAPTPAAIPAPSTDNVVPITRVNIAASVSDDMRRRPSTPPLPQRKPRDYDAERTMTPDPLGSTPEEAQTSAAYEPTDTTPSRSRKKRRSESPPASFSRTPQRVTPQPPDLCSPDLPVVDQEFFSTDVEIDTNLDGSPARLTHAPPLMHPPSISPVQPAHAYAPPISSVVANGKTLNNGQQPPSLNGISSSAMNVQIQTPRWEDMVAKLSKRHPYVYVVSDSERIRQLIDLFPIRCRYMRAANLLCEYRKHYYVGLNGKAVAPADADQDADARAELARLVDSSDAQLQLQTIRSETWVKIKQIKTNDANIDDDLLDMSRLLHVLVQPNTDIDAMALVDMMHAELNTNALGLDGLDSLLQTEHQQCCKLYGNGRVLVNRASHKQHTPTIKPNPKQVLSAIAHIPIPEDNDTITSMIMHAHMMNMWLVNTDNVHDLSIEPDVLDERINVFDMAMY